MVNLAARRHFQPMYQIWLKYMQKWPTYVQKCDFQYGGHRHLGFCKIWILLVKPVTEPHFLCLCEILCKSVEKWLSYGTSTNFKMGHRHLGFSTYFNFDSKSRCRTPFSVYASNLAQIYAKMADLWPKVWFLQRGSIACYAKRCTSYRKSVCLTVWPSVCHSPVLCQNDSS